MMKKSFINILLLTVALFSLKSTNIFSAETNSAVQDSSNAKVLFKFNDKVGVVYTLKGISTVKFYANNALRQTAVSHWESVQTAASTSEEGIKFKYTYKSSRAGRELSNVTSNFIRKPNGEMKVAADSFYPQSISTPVFLSTPVQIGHSWEAPGEEIIDFRKLGSPEPYRLKFTARYVYKGIQKIDGKPLAVVHVFYIVNDNQQRRIYVPLFRAGGGEGSYLPARLMGYFERTFYWDIQENYWKKMDASINFILTLTGGMTVEWESSVASSMSKTG